MENDKPDIKINYSDETIAILNDINLKYELERSHRLRAEDNLNPYSDVALLLYVLKLYNRKKTRKLNRRKKRKEAKNEINTN